MPFPLLFLLLLLLLPPTTPIPLLDSIPLLFSITGTTPYISDTGNSLTGYSLSVGFDHYSWLGIKFATSGNNDVLIIKRDSSFTGNAQGGGYKVSVEDYYVPQGNPDRLNSDTMTSKDVTMNSYPMTNAFTLTFTRSVSGNSGEDWDASAGSYSML